jgi:hypothetical protein
MRLTGKAQDQFVSRKDRSEFGPLPITWKRRAGSIIRLYLILNAICRHPLSRPKRREFLRSQLIVERFGAAFKALEVENPQLAATLFDEAIGPDLEAAPSHALQQYGVALAWVGRADDAERALRLAFAKEPSALLAYRFGSVLAEQRKFSEASAVFASIDRHQPWLEGGSMRSIWFPARQDDLRILDVPLRRTVNGLFDRSTRDRDFVYFVAADSRYAKRFARALHSSLAAVHANCLLHIHVINPDPAASELLAYMMKRPGPMVAFSSEEVDLSALSVDQRRVYYASARFFILSALHRHYDKPVIAADIDQVVLRDPAPLIEPGSDVAAIRFPYGRFNLMARFSASVIIAATPAAAIYFDRVAAYIAGRMRDSQAIAWHLDQIALDVAYLVSDDIVLSELPSGAMLSAAPDADVPNDTYFWSVTYSVAANARKLAHPIFQKLEAAPLIVVTPVFDHSDGLERTIASVARDGYSNVAHVVIDHRRADRLLGSKNRGTAGFAFSESTQDGGGFADVIIETPKAIFVELPCGEELAPQTLLEIMLAVEKGGLHLQARRNDGSEVLDLPARIGHGSKGDRLTVFRKAEWTAHHSRVKVIMRP